MEVSCASGAAEPDEAHGRDAASNSLKRDLFKSILPGQAAAMHTSRIHGFFVERLHRLFVVPARSGNPAEAPLLGSGAPLRFGRNYYKRGSSNSLMRDEDRQGGVGEDVAGDAAEQQFLQPALDVVPHDEEIGVESGSAAQEVGADRVAARLEHAGARLDAVPGEIVDEPLALAGARARRLDSKHGDRL